MIPGQLIALLTFPGVIIHEMAHQFFCRRLHVAVLDVCYFRFGSPAGYVIHEKPKSDSQQILIGIGPFLVNTILAALVSFPAAIQVLQFETGSFLDYVLIWLGISIGMHSFPSTVDAKGIWAAAWAPTTSLPVRLIALPIVALIYIGAIGSVFWLDAIYGGLLAMAVPTLIIALLA